MAIQWNKKRDYPVTTDHIRERLYDGRVMDEWELTERTMLYRQLQVLFGIPKTGARNIMV